MILGRKTYEGLAAFWPQQTGESTRPYEGATSRWSRRKAKGNRPVAEAALSTLAAAVAGVRRRGASRVDVRLTAA